jgi:carboxyl-terminal processing protease
VPPKGGHVTSSVGQALDRRRFVRHDARVSVRGAAWWSGFACGLGVAALIALGAAQAVPEAAAGRHAGFDREAFHQALDAVLDRYVDPIDGSILLARGLKHMVAGLDAYSHFLTAQERKALRAQAHDGTAGLSVHLHVAPGGEDRLLEVVGVLPGSAAALAGLAPGDHILEIDGLEVGRLLSQVEAEAKLAGEVGQALALRVQRRRQASPERLDLVLDEAPRELLSAELVTVTRGEGKAPQKAAVIQLRGFRKGVGQAFGKRLAQLRRSAGPDGLAAVVLDLRGNPGGEVDEALVVADLFVADGILTRTRGRGGRILREELAHDAGTDETTPLVVLQDRHTASAAELLTAALRDNGRAKSVGERSYGKGTVQEVMGLPDGSVLKLTIARYFSPKDAAIDGVGVVPDVALSIVQRTRAVDEALAVVGLRLVE